MECDWILFFHPVLAFSFTKHSSETCQETSAQSLCSSSAAVLLGLNIVSILIIPRPAGGLLCTPNHVYSTNRTQGQLPAVHGGSLFNRTLGLLYSP